MTRSPLSNYRREALWGLVACSQVLVDLYRTLGDSKQQDRALRLGSYGIEQLQRGNLYQVAELRRRMEELRGGMADEAELERVAWRRGLQAGFELAFLVNLGTGASDPRGLQGATGQVQRTLGASVLGIDTAFPAETAGLLARTALEAAEAVARGVLQSQFHENSDELSEAEVQSLIEEALPSIRDSIWAGVVQLRPTWA